MSIQSASAPSAGAQGKGSEAEPKGDLIACTGAEALLRIEKAICGQFAVPSPAMAQGLALAGSLSASQLSATPSLEEPIPRTDVPLPCVHHRWLSGRELPGTVELVPESVQEAVDLCLVAHLLAATHGTPVVCRISPAVANAYGLVRFPDSATVDRLVRMCRTSSGADTPEMAYRSVALGVRRACQPVRCYQTGDADVVLVALGPDANEAIDAIEILRAAGMQGGVVGITQWRPFPDAALCNAVKKAASVLVLKPELVGDAFELAVRTALSDQENGVEVMDIASGQASGQLTHAIRAYFAKDGEIEPNLEVPGSNGSPVLRLSSTAEDGRGPELLNAVLGCIGRVEKPLVVTGVPTLGSAVATATFGKSPSLEDQPADLLIGSAAGLLEPADAQLATGAAVLLPAAAEETLDAVWGLIPPATREILVASDAVLALSTSTVADEWVGAVLGLLDQVASDRFSSPLAPRVVQTLTSENGISSIRSDRITNGAEGIRYESCRSVEERFQNREHLFAPGDELPRPELQTSDGDGAQWKDALRHFHVTGSRPHGLPNPGSHGIKPLSGHLAGQAAYPLYVGKPDGASEVGAWHSMLLQAVAESGGSLPIIERNLDWLTALADKMVPPQGGVQKADAVREQSLDTFAKLLETSEEGAQALQAECSVFSEHLPTDGWVVGLGERTLLDLVSLALGREETPSRSAFSNELKRLIGGLTDLLAVDDQNDPSTADSHSVAASLGSTSSLFNASALASTTPAQRGSLRLTPERRARVEAVLERLETFRDDAADWPSVVVLCRDALPGHPSQLTVVRHESPFLAAIGYFDAMAGRFMDVLRAMRTADLDLDNQFEGDLHGALIDRLTWQSCEPKELAWLPAVVVIERADHVEQRSVGALSQALVSGRPLRIIISDPEIGAVAPVMPGGEHRLVGDLAMIGVAHREAFVLQSTLARPIHLVDGLREMSSVSRPGLAVVAVPKRSGYEGWLRLNAMSRARTPACFSFDPGQGSTWATRFRLDDNEAPHQLWPTDRLELAEGSEPLAAPVTYADAAVSLAELSSHFLVLPDEAWSDEQTPLADYLTSSDDTGSPRIPFIWVLCEDNVVRRAAVSRALTVAAWERMRSWRMLQELAGIDNQHATKAAEAMRQQMEEEAAALRSALEAEHADEISRVQSEAASLAMDRLVAVLLDDDLLSSAPASPRPLPAAPVIAEAGDQPAEQAQAPAAAEPAAEPEDDVIAEEAYIDTFLCTSCNECLNINPQVFLYDENKQAVIGDLSKGTFAQLVQAAEKCPATCIHPGAPTAGDASATPDMIARAAPFNS